MDEKKNKPYWQPAMEIFSEVSTWIVGPIVFALIFGKMLDKHYGTAPVMFLILIGISFLLSSYGIVRAVRNYTKKLKDIEKK
jgi:F0F1-type ATP synthase assembly protein I